MDNITIDQVRSSLKQCMDPEVPLSIVDMGLVYGIDISDNNDVNIKMTMTTKGCPLHETMVDDVKRYTRKVIGVNDVNVDIVWDPPWSMDRMSPEAKSMMKKTLCNSVMIGRGSIGNPWIFNQQYLNLNDIQRETYKKNIIIKHIELIRNFTSYNFHGALLHVYNG